MYKRALPREVQRRHDDSASLELGDEGPDSDNDSDSEQEENDWSVDQDILQKGEMGEKVILL